MYTIHEILAADNEVSRLLAIYRERTGSKVRVKGKPWWLRIFSSKTLCVMIGSVIYWSQRLYQRMWEALPTMAHELTHDAQKRSSWTHSIRYAMPQVFAVLAIGALLWWPMIFALLFLLPWPSPWRADIEAEAYAATRKTQEALKMRPVDCAPVLVSWKYWWCCWTQDSARRRISEHEKRETKVDGMIKEVLGIDD